MAEPLTVGAGPTCRAAEPGGDSLPRGWDAGYEVQRLKSKKGYRILQSRAHVLTGWLTARFEPIQSREVCRLGRAGLEEGRPAIVRSRRLRRRRYFLPGMTSRQLVRLPVRLQRGSCSETDPRGPRDRTRVWNRIPTAG